MNVIALKNLEKFWLIHADSKITLSAWYKIAKRCKWSNVNEIKNTFPNVSVLSNSRVVFNIKGNTYRVVVAFRFTLGLAYICFIGTHDEYNKINANEVWDY
jgi:mRNA interferase HigB